MSINADTPYPGSKHPVLPILPRPPRTEPSYPPEPPPESAPSVSRNGVIHPPTPFALIAQRAERQPPKVVLTADEAAERMKSLKERQAEDPVLKQQIADLRADHSSLAILVRNQQLELDAMRQKIGQIDDSLTRHVTGIQQSLSGILEFCETVRERLAGGEFEFGTITETHADARRGASPVPKKIAAKKKPKP